MICNQIEDLVDFYETGAPCIDYTEQWTHLEGHTMPRKRTLIPSPLAWTPLNLPVAHPALPVVAQRGGTQLRTPLPTFVVDTREQNPLSFRRFRGWFAKIEYRALPLGDYSVKGMEDNCVVERKDLADLICSFTTNR